MTNPGQQAAQQAAAAASRAAQQSAATSNRIAQQHASSLFNSSSTYRGRGRRRIGFFGLIGRLIGLVITLVIIGIAVGIFVLVLHRV